MSNEPSISDEAWKNSLEIYMQGFQDGMIANQNKQAQEADREGEGICRDCYIKCCRLAVKLEGGMVPMDALGCSSGGHCDRYLIDFLNKLVKREKESRLKEQPCQTKP
mgnify:CR=1 FL=1